MTTIKNFFSPTKTSPVMTPSPAKSDKKSIHARPDNKLIVSNMKSVINSVKLHKKHKKRKRNLDETPEIHDISNILQSNLSFISPNRTEPILSVDVIKVTTIAEVKSADSSVVASEDSSKENNSMNENTNTTMPSQSTDTKSQSTSNAFEFMMTARYKSIGTNSPGRELSSKEIEPPVTDREVTVKRKLMLEEWADRKGRAKKRQVEADDEYIDMVMDKRAKRLRTLLKNGKKEMETTISDEETVPAKPLKQTKGKNRIEEPPNGTKLKIAKRKNRIEDSDDEHVSEHRKSSMKSLNRTLTNGKVKATNSVPDESFSEKLSSPLKKRDSLLGYFSKLTKTPSVEGSSKISENISPAVDSSDSKNWIKKRGRPRKTLPVNEVVATVTLNDATSLQIGALSADDVIDVVTIIEDSQDETSSPSITRTEESTNPPLSEGRPKRLCRDKKVSYLIDEDSTPVRTREKKIVDKEYVTPKASGKQSKPTKLAPIFAKATPKPFIDPTVLRARHEFLMSGIPEKMKLEMEKQRQFEEFYETEFEIFPKISHVGYHAEPISEVGIELSKLNIRFKPAVVEEEEEEGATTRSLHANILKVRPSHNDGRKQLESNSTDTSIGQKDLMRLLKQTDASEFPHYRCFKQLKRKNAIDPVIEDVDGGGDSSIELIVEKVASVNGNELFTEKYRSLNSSEVLLNTKPLIELQKFLLSWKENMDGGRECANSSDEFDTNSNSGMSSMNKAIVLTGPPGCGKTMFVYALANEMNFKVLEINAGAKRTGKKVLKKLQEATQSHHVNNNQCSQSERSKTKGSQSEDSEDVGGSQKLSLILIEDAEVVFDEDLGFVESINQLVTTTKRPVILITNQVNCPHLSRFINRNTISFGAPKWSIASKWLSTLSVAEQCYVQEDMCRTLYHQNNCDFRKTLLELQFFIQSTSRTQLLGDAVLYTNNKLRELFFNDQNRLERIVAFPVDFHNLTKSNRILGERNGSESTDSLSETAAFLNNISTAQWLEQKTDSSDRLVNHLNDDISHFLVEQSIKIRNRNRPNSDNSAFGSDPMRRPQLALSVSSRNHHSTRGFDLDIEPCLRSICRSELVRSHKERRSSRFYHYLRCANSDSFGTKTLDDHCLVFRRQ